jgi:hypothetical protein
MAYDPYLSGGANESRPQMRDRCKMDLLASLCALAGLQGPAAIRVQHISREVQPMSPLNETEGFEPGDDLLDKADCHRADVAGSLSATEN